MKVLRVTTKNARELHHLLNSSDIKIFDQINLDVDEDDKTFHLGALVDGQIVSIVSFLMEKNPLIDHKYQYRLIGNVTQPAYINCGYDKELLKISFPIIKQNMCSAVWCNADDSNVTFFKNVGFEFNSNTSVKQSQQIVPSINKHLMVKTLL